MKIRHRDTETRRYTEKNLNEQDEQDMQDKNKIVFRLIPKPFILFILSILVNFAFAV